MDLPHPEGRFDFVISIATIHHLSTRERRIAAIVALLNVLRRNKHSSGNTGTGKALIFVWALEQKASRRGWDVGDKQDILVPWVKKPLKGENINESNKDGNTFQRYYHLYAQGELEADLQAAGGQLVSRGYDRDNWWVVASP